MARVLAARVLLAMMLAVFLVVLMGACASAQAQAPPGDSSRVLVRFRPGGPPDHAAAWKGQGRRLRQLERLGVEVVEVSRGKSAQALLRSLRGRADVEFAEIDRRVPHDGFAFGGRPSYATSHNFGVPISSLVSATKNQPAPQTLPNDPLYPNQWHLPRVGAPVAWGTTTGAASVIVAVLDTGCDPAHPDLSPKYVPGWNLFDGNADTADVQGHGTAVAGTAAAQGGDGVGVASVAWGPVRIMPIRISDATGWAYWSTLADGIRWAADRGARVVNASYQCSDSLTVQSAADYLATKGGVFVASAGNASTALTAANPASVLTVGATDRADAKTSWSNTGPIVDLVAPGIDVYTTSRGGAWGWWWGTSFSSPTVAGAAALVISARPDLVPSQVRDCIVATARDLGTPGRDDLYGAGLLDVGAAVARAVSLPADPPPTPPPAPSMAVAITSPAAGASVSGTVYVLASVSGPVVRVTLLVDGRPTSRSSRSPWTTVWDTRGSKTGTRTLVLEAQDAAGAKVRSAPVVVTVRR
jgi:subtilisin family serine protease